MRKLFPKMIRNIIKNNLGITELHEQIRKLHERIGRVENINKIIVGDWKLSIDDGERAKKRWTHCTPDNDLTWGNEINGTNFILKASSYNVFSSDKSIVEIGPGYGRLLNACLKENIPYKNYSAIDLSSNNINHLKEKYSSSNVNFIHGDIEKISLSAQFDILISSLTFKHLYPTFVPGLRNISKYLSPGGMLFFDLMEGTNVLFEQDEVTYIKEYTQKEVNNLLSDLNFTIVSFDYVIHDSEHKRLLVVAKKKL